LNTHFSSTFASVRKKSLRIVRDLTVLALWSKKGPGVYEAPGIGTTHKEKAVHSDIVTVQRDNQVFVSSREVAAKFGKRHSDVVRDIKKLFFTNKDKQEFMQFFSRNFAEQRISLDNSPRRGRPPEPHYLMTRDGFAFLAMGFTGRKAIEWKVRFLEAFNLMERTIVEQIPALKARIAELESRPLKVLPGPRKDMIPVPIMQENLFGVVEAVRWELRHKETLDELQKAKAQARQLRKMLKGLAAKHDVLNERIDLLEGNKKSKLIRILKDEPEKPI
jgi:Rha family phage regulatory protein